MSFNEEYKQRTEYIEEVLKKYLPEKEGYQSVIMDAMEYSLMAGGKRLRPILMLETYRLFGGSGKEIEPFLAAIEMIHTYSLVHDDLPAMDNDDYRRGRKTTHIVYGEDMGILAGDALLNYAFETALRAFDGNPEHCVRAGKALKILAQKAGIYGMIGGQVVDVKDAGHAVSGEMLDFYLPPEDRCASGGVHDGRSRDGRCFGRRCGGDRENCGKDRPGFPDSGRYP